MKALIAILFLGVCLGFQAKPDSKSPSDSEQVQVMALYSKQLEAQIQYEQAGAQIAALQKQMETAKKSFEDLQSQRDKVIAGLKDKLDKPPAGKEWQTTAGEAGKVSFTLADIPKDKDAKDAKPVAQVTPPAK